MVVGCKGLSSGDEDVESVKKYDKVWTKDNSSTTEYLRFFDQFGTNKKVKTATVQLKVSNAKNARAGLVFGLNENEDKTVSFYVLGVGANAETGKPLYYLDYYAALDPKSMSASTENETLGSSEPESIVGKNSNGIATFTDENVKVAEDGSMSVVVKIDMTDKTAIKVSIGSTESKMNTEITPFAHKVAGAADALGGIGAYGMLRPATAGNIIKTVNNYTVLESDPARTLLSAEEAE